MTVWVKHLNKAVNKVSSVIGMRPKGAIKLDTVPPGKTYPEETAMSKMDCIDTFIDLEYNIETKEDGQQTSFGVKIGID